MVEIRTRLVSVEIDQSCTCVIGRMRPTGKALMSNPPIYPHQCDKCGIVVSYPVIYPTIVLEPDEQMR
jgi:hypothetical protein